MPTTTAAAVTTRDSSYKTQLAESESDVTEHSYQHHRDESEIEDRQEEEELYNQNDAVTKLNYTRLKKLYGRSNELKSLQQAYDRIAVNKSQGHSIDAIDGAGDSDGDDCSKTSTNTTSSSSTSYHSEICLVTGFSGTGKTTLVGQLKEYSDSMFFASGKFDQLRGTKPYSALSSAVDELCTNILQSESSNIIKDKVIDSIINKMNGGRQLANVLINVMPAAQSLLSLENDDERRKEETVSNHKGNGDAGSEVHDVIGNKEALEQLKYVFRAFLRSICTEDHPVVVFIDDLQWIDSASLDLLMDVLVDSELKHLLFIGAYRDSEVNDSHPFIVSIRRVEEQRIQQRSRMTRVKMQSDVNALQTNNEDEMTASKKEIQVIKLDNLQVESVNELLSDLLHQEMSRTRELADIVVRRTHGNAFFVLEYIKHLHEEGLLYFSTASLSLSWTWDIDRIVDDTTVSDNVVELIVAKFRKNLPDLMKDLLMIASCLDNTFHSIVLWQIVKDNDAADNISTTSSISTPSATTSTTAALDVKLEKMADLNFLLESLVDEGIIEKTARLNWYKFSHDRFQQAAYALLDEADERQALHHRIGRILLPKIRESSHEVWRSFVAVDQLNKSSACIVGEHSQLMMANLNLFAGQMAAQRSAYIPAMEYLSTGIEYLPQEGKWDKHYQLCLDLYSAAAEIAYVNGEFEEAYRFCFEILKNARIGMDKMRASFTLVDCLGSQQKSEECLALAFEILRDTLDEPFPRKINLFHVVSSLMKTQRMLRRMSDGDLLSLPVMTDERKIAAMKFLTSISTQAYWLQKPEVLAMVNFRMMQLSVKFGVAKLSPAAFARYGLLICAIKGDIKESYRFGKLSLTLVDQLGASEWESQVICLATQFSLHWQEPLQNLTEMLLNAYRLGNEHGDIEYALLSAGGYALCYYHSGLKLNPMVKDLAEFCNQMKERGQYAGFYATVPYWQAVLNLMGRSKDPLQLTGEAMCEEDVVKIATEAKNMNSLQNLWLFRAQLAYFHGKYGEALHFADKFRKTSESARSHIVFPSFVFYSGLINLACAKEEKRRKFFVGARSDIKTLKNWVQMGAINSFHKLKLLEAQLKSLKQVSKVQAVKGDFEKAINAAARAGYLQDRAIAHQLLGEYLLCNGVSVDGQHHINRAYEIFTEWGAIAVANHIQEAYSETIQTSSYHGSVLSTKRVVGTGVKARTRFGQVSQSRQGSSKSDLLRVSLEENGGASRTNLHQEGPGNRRNSSYASVENIQDAIEESGFNLVNKSGNDVLEVVSEINIPNPSIQS